MSKRILIVDDAAFMRMMIKDILSKNGFEVVGEAADGLQAVEKYNELKPDLVTMDVTMPVMTGIAAVKKIIPEFPNAKIIMVTALGQQKLIVEAIESGAKDFITKPFEPERLRAVADQVLGQNC